MAKRETATTRAVLMKENKDLQRQNEELIEVNKRQLSKLINQELVAMRVKELEKLVKELRGK